MTIVRRNRIDRFFLLMVERGLRFALQREPTADVPSQRRDRPAALSR